MRTDRLMSWCVLLLAMILLSCSGDHNPQTPPIPSGTQNLQSSQVSSDTGNRYLWSYNEIVINDNNTSEIIPLRDASTHWNVLKWLEKTPCSNCLKINGITPISANQIEVSIEIKHPFADPKLTGFDVRGIAMFHGTYSFPKAGLVTSSRAAGQGELINADGFTSLYNYMTAGKGPGGLQGYITGKNSTPIYPDTSLNGFKRFVSPDPGNTRNAFYAGTSITQVFEIVKPSSGVLILGYAVDACWAPPTVTPVTNLLTDFPPEANSPEPWRVDYSETPIGDGLISSGGQSKITLDISDYQGKLSYYVPSLECPQLFDGLVYAVFKQDGATYTRFEAIVENKKLAPNGIYKCLIKVRDVDADSAPGWLDLTAYNILPLGVGMQLPSSVTGFSVSDGDPTIANRSVKLTWTANSGSIDWYDIDRLDYDWSKGWTWKAVKSAANGTVEWTDGNTRYCGPDNPTQYRISARNSAGSSGYSTDTGYPKPRGMHMALWCAADDAGGSGASTSWSRAQTDFNYCNQFWNRFGLNFVLKNSGNFFWAGNPAYKDLMGNEPFDMHNSCGVAQHPDSVNVYYVNSADGNNTKAYCNTICPGSMHNTETIFIVISNDASGTPPDGITITLAHEVGHAAARLFDMYTLDSNANLKLDDGTSCAANNTWCNSAPNIPKLFCDENAAYQQDPGAFNKNPWNLMWYAVPGKSVSNYNLYPTQGVWLHEWVQGNKNNYPFPQ